MAKPEEKTFINCADEMPPEGVVVETVTASGMTSRLMRRGRMWFVPDGSMYVYYNPIAYREIESIPNSKEPKDA